MFWMTTQRSKKHGQWVEEGAFSMQSPWRRFDKCLKFESSISTERSTGWRGQFSYFQEWSFNTSLTVLPLFFLSFYKSGCCLWMVHCFVIDQHVYWCTAEIILWALSCLLDTTSQSVLKMVRCVIVAQGLEFPMLISDFTCSMQVGINMKNPNPYWGQLIDIKDVGNFPMSDWWSLSTVSLCTYCTGQISAKE